MTKTLSQLIELQTRLIKEQVITAELLREFFLAISDEISEGAGRDFARTILAMSLVSYGTFLAELDAFASRGYKFSVKRAAIAPKDMDLGDHTKAIKLRFFAHPEHLVGISRRQRRKLPLATI